MRQLTLDEVLSLPVLRQAGAEVLAAAADIGRPVRWLHASDLHDVAALLRAGDLVLTTGTGFDTDDDPQSFHAYASQLDAAGAAGVIVELGRRWRGALPAAMITAFDTVGLPLVSLAHEVRFAAITQAVGELIVDRRLAELRDAERVHEIFTELSFNQASPDDILAAVQRLSGSTVAVESDQHQVIDYLAGPGDESAFFADWAVRSARVRIDGRTGWDRDNGWLLTRLGPKERRWGRLIIQSPEAPPQHLVAVAERAAAALTLYRFHHRDRDNLVRRSHFELLSNLIRGPVSADIARKCEVAGFPVAGRKFVALAARPYGASEGRRSPSAEDLIATAAYACSELRTPALIADVDGDAQVLLSCPERANVIDLIDRLGACLARHHRALMGAGRDVPALETASATLLEARQVVDAIRSGAESVVHRLEDVHVRGLVTLLGDDERLRLFVHRELHELAMHDAQSTVSLTEAVRALLWHPSSKTEAAASLHLSRAAFYVRLARAERILGVDLDDPDIRLSLHLALLASDLAPGHG